mmetsp:Transcript_52182/g.163889  ORF Transcript_52182/g.163889 Transcript_52182/m.163889 type:complete len:228 (+) Transcript_52182:260-943(+)
MGSTCVRACPHSPTDAIGKQSRAKAPTSTTPRKPSSMRELAACTPRPKQPSAQHCDLVLPTGCKHHSLRRCTSTLRARGRCRRFGGRERRNVQALEILGRLRQYVGQPQRAHRGAPRRGNPGDVGFAVDDISLHLQAAALLAILHRPHRLRDAVPVGLHGIVHRVGEEIHLISVTLLAVLQPHGWDVRLEHVVHLRVCGTKPCGFDVPGEPALQHRVPGELAKVRRR